MPTNQIIIMKIFFRLVFLTTSFFLSNIEKIYSQDFIYTNEQTIIKGKIVGFEGDDLLFIEETTDKVATKKLNSIAVLFNQRGNFLLPDELLTKPENRVEVINEYFNAPSLSTKYDLLIYKSPVDVIRCNITYESEEIVNFKTIKTGESRTENKKEILLIIYMNGKHSFFTDPTPLIGELKLLKEKIKLKVLDDDNVEDRQAKIVVEKPNPKPVEPAPIEQVSNVDTSAAIAPTMPKLNDEEYQTYRKKAKVKVDDFVSFLNIITNKELDATEKDKAIEQTIKLFTPGSTIQVSMKMPDGTVKMTTRKVEDYLKRLKLSPYSSVNIEWTDVQYISELKQETDGNYYGMITGEQRFSGYDANGNVKYTDITQKNVKVMVKSYKKIIEAIENQQWEVFLGNIGIVETK